jgi:alkylation response protein AidB-like acyl-CoA dehydrogenase
MTVLGAAAPRTDQPDPAPAGGYPEDPVAAAARLAPEIAERASEGERLGRVPPDLFDRLQQAGLIDLMLPAALGGLELDPLTVIDVISTLSGADGSVGFTVLTLNATCYVAWLPEPAARRVLAGRPRAVATVFTPLGRAHPQPDGSLTVTGRWPFNTGCRNASWVCNGVLVMDGDRPATVPPGRPDWRLVFIPRDQAEILDTWEVAGLRGTGSNDTAVSAVRVAPELTANPIFEPSRHPGPLYRWSFFALMGVQFAGFPLGIARRALDEFRTLAPVKSRGSRPLAQEQSVQLAVVRCEADLRAARAFVTDVFGTAWQRTTAGDELTMADRVAVRLATGRAMRAGVTVVDTVFRLAGGGALYDRSPLQRCWRDLNAGSHHGYVSEYHETRTGRALLGLPVPDSWMM